MHSQFKTIFVLSALLIGCGGSGPSTETPPEPDASVDVPASPDAAVPPEGPVIDNGSLTIVEGSGDNTPLPVDEELPAQLVKTFDCRPEQVGDELVMTNVAGQEDDQVVIRPSGTEACHYDLIYRNASGNEHVLSGSDASGYLFTVAQQLSDSVTLVCVNNIRHHPVDGVVHTIDEVTIDCAARVNGTWTALQSVVAPDGPWAAWIREVAPDKSQPNAVHLSFAHDFSFQFMNLTDNGRPEDDGLYKVTFVITDAGINVSESSKTADKQNPLAGGEFTEWQPTAQEEVDYSEFMTIDDGPCPNGCPIEEEEEEEEKP